MFSCGGWCCGAAQRRKRVADHRSARVIQRVYRLHALRKAMVAFAMGAHPRLGGGENFNADIVDLVLGKVVEEGNYCGCCDASGSWRFRRGRAAISMMLN